MEGNDRHKRWKIKSENLNESEKSCKKLVKHKGDKILCRICDHVLPLKSIVRSMRFHYIKHGINLKNLCHKCFKCYPAMNKSDLHKHSIKCSNKHFSSKCPKCGLDIQSVMGIKTHECQICEYCKGIFGNQANLRLHLNQCASKKKKYNCEKCRRVYMEVSDLNSHLCNRNMQSITYHERIIQCRPDKTGRNTQCVFWKK